VEGGSVKKERDGSARGKPKGRPVDTRALAEVQALLKEEPRRRDLLRYSFRGQWKPTGPMQRAGLVHAAMGTLGPRPALGFIVGPEQTRGGGVGIEEAAVVTDMLRLAAHAPAAAARAAVLRSGPPSSFTKQRTSPRCS